MTTAIQNCTCLAFTGTSNVSALHLKNIASIHYGKRHGIFFILIAGFFLSFIVFWYKNFIILLISLNLGNKLNQAVAHLVLYSENIWFLPRWERRLQGWVFLVFLSLRRTQVFARIFHVTFNSLLKSHYSIVFPFNAMQNHLLTAFWNNLTINEIYLYMHRASDWGKLVFCVCCWAIAETPV